MNRPPYGTQRPTRVPRPLEPARSDYNNFYYVEVAIYHPTQ